MSTALKFHAEPDVDPAAFSQELAALRAGERVARLRERFGGNLVASTSFGLQSAIMLHLIAQHAPEVPIIFIDTGFLFPETYQYAEKLTKQLDLDIRVYPENALGAIVQYQVTGLIEPAAGESSSSSSSFTPSDCQ